MRATIGWRQSKRGAGICPDEQHMERGVEPAGRTAWHSAGVYRRLLNADGAYAYLYSGSRMADHASRNSSIA